MTKDVIVGNITLSASVGFDETGRPAEIFLSGAKNVSGLAAILEDASVVISVALQHGIRGAALAKSVARIPEDLDGPATKAALDLLVSYENIAMCDDVAEGARPQQLPPAGSWRVWLLMAGRGFGKTRCGAEWVRAEVKARNGDTNALP